ncbi:MAG: tyrosine-protein phosphatase [Planctomycetes bacterium]|nr:tyrosine-protein phosphatase [Planctomycetota bacterium]
MNQEQKTAVPDLALTFPHQPDYTPRMWGYENRRLTHKRAWLAGMALGVTTIVLLFAIFALHRWGGNNFHVVRENEWYRCTQLDGDDMEVLAKRYRVKTLLALRGANPDDNAWYEPEARAAENAGAKLVVAKLATSRPPWRSELRTLFQELDRVEYPVLVHCKHGSDRTGLVSAIWLHDYRGVPLDEARGQLALLPYMHFSFGDAAAVHKLLNEYEAWQRANPGDNSNIRDWVKQHWFIEKEGRALEPWYDGVMYKPD